MFEVGDYVVSVDSDFEDGLTICKVMDWEIVDESSDLWMPGFDFVPYISYRTEIVYHIENANQRLKFEVGDTIFFDDENAVSLNEYLNREITVQDYYNYTYKGINIYKNNAEE